jgi:hypothetical protein
VSGMIASVPNQGGIAWIMLHFFLGLRRLGHEVFFLEQCDESDIRPIGAPLERSENASYFKSVTTQFGFDQESCLWLAGTKETIGPSHAEVRAIAGNADVLLNISGVLKDETLFEEISTRVLVDLDPAFTQLWHEEGVDMGISGHTHHVTVGQAIGTSDCRIPIGGVTWIPTLQPVVLDLWPEAHRVVEDAFTTVANWRGYGSTTYKGVHYGQKAHSLRKFISLPKDTGERFLLAMAIDPGEEKDIEALAENGWEVVDPMTVARGPADYQAFVQGSRAEFGIAKSGYVASSCGWFSDRSACYLASGRPVIAQDTGFSRFLPTGEGLFAFEVEDDIVAAIAELKRDYPRHARAARNLAEEYFDSDKVLGRLLEGVASDD